jgi:hypothetical protein
VEYRFVWTGPDVPKQGIIVELPDILPLVLS